MPRHGDEPVLGYHLDRRLGRGSFGEVWSATGPGGTLAALKFISLSDMQGLREFRAIQRIKQIRHANLMGIIGIWLIGQHGNPLNDEFLAQWGALAPSPEPSATATLHLPKTDKQRPVELIEAMPLGDQDLLGRLEDCRAAGHIGIPPHELMQYLEDAARAIDFLNSPRHDLGEGPIAIHHGDIKPQNIMLIGASAQVCDFGLARILGSSQATTTALAGSPAYMAPEMIRDKRPHPATDQYALAITYVELRTGALPFDDASYLEVMQAHLNGTLNLSAMVNAERAVIERATALEPSKRFGSTLEMVWALRDAQRMPHHHQELPEHERGPQPIEVLDASTIPAERHPASAVVKESQPLATSAAELDAPVTSALRNTPRQRPVGNTDPSPMHYPAATPPQLAQPPVSTGYRRAVVIAMASSVLGVILLVTGPWFGYRSATSVKGLTTAGIVELMPLQTLDVSSPQAAPTPANLPPTIELVTVEPAKPLAGGTLTVRLQGEDPEQRPITYQYRLDSEDTWIDAPEGRVHLENLAPGDLVVEMRTMDEQGCHSNIISRRWQIVLPNRAPVISIASATERLSEGDTLRVRLSGTDPDKDTLTFEWHTGESQDWQGLDGNEIEMADVREGQLSLTVRAVDAAGATSEAINRIWSVEQSLMWSFKVIMILEFAAKHVHMPMSENYKMIQAFLLNRLNESLDEGNRIG